MPEIIELPEEYHQLVDELYGARKENALNLSDPEFARKISKIRKFDLESLKSRLNLVKSSNVLVDKSPQELDRSRRLSFEKNFLSILLKEIASLTPPTEIRRDIHSLRVFDLAGPKFEKAANAVLQKQHSISEPEIFSFSKKNLSNIQKALKTRLELPKFEEKKAEDKTQGEKIGNEYVGAYKVKELIDLVKGRHAISPGAIKRLSHKSAMILKSLINAKDTIDLGALANEHNLKTPILKNRILGILKKYYKFDANKKN